MLLLLLHDLQYDRWKFQTLQDWRWNPLIYTRIAGDGLYNLLAREFAPAPERLKNLGKRLDECRVSWRRCARCWSPRACRRCTRKPRRNRTPD